MRLLEKITLNGLASYSTLQFDNGEQLPLLMATKAGESAIADAPVAVKTKFNEYFVSIVGEFSFCCN